MLYSTALFTSTLLQSLMPLWGNIIFALLNKIFVYYCSHFVNSIPLWSQRLLCDWHTSPEIFRSFLQPTTVFYRRAFFVRHCRNRSWATLTKKDHWIIWRSRRTCDWSTSTIQHLKYMRLRCSSTIKRKIRAISRRCQWTSAKVTLAGCLGVKSHPIEVTRLLGVQRCYSAADIMDATLW